MERIKKYGLPWLTNYGWQIVGRALVAIGLLGLVVLQLGGGEPMSNAYWPEGCNPPETCFACRHPDCRNSLAGTKKEFDFTRRGLVPDYVPAHGSNEKRNARRRFREENGLCIYCGKPLTAEDGEHKSCAACREAYRAKYRECKKNKPCGKHS